MSSSFSVFYCRHTTMRCLLILQAPFCSPFGSKHHCLCMLSRKVVSFLSLCAVMSWHCLLASYRSGFKSCLTHSFCVSLKLSWMPGSSSVFYSRLSMVFILQARFSSLFGSTHHCLCAVLRKVVSLALFNHVCRQCLFAYKSGFKFYLEHSFCISLGCSSKCHEVQASSIVAFLRWDIIKHLSVHSLNYLPLLVRYWEELL